MATPPHRVLETLYAESPKTFTARRNALAAELTRAGQADAAAALKRVRKPSATLWAVNQLSRRASADVDAFLDSVQRLRRTQLRDPRGASEAIRLQRQQLDRLAQRAASLLSEAGSRPTPAALRRISDTLLGAAADTGRAQELRQGRLTEELSAPGFEALAGATSGRPPLRLVERRADASKPADIDGAVPRRQALERREREREEREREARERRARQQEARRQEAEELERRATSARETAARLERERAELRARLAGLDREARVASRASKQATAAARRAGRAVRRPSAR